jgi:hypothetical protein
MDELRKDKMFAAYRVQDIVARPKNKWDRLKQWTQMRMMNREWRNAIRANIDRVELTDEEKTHKDEMLRQYELSLIQQGKTKAEAVKTIKENRLGLDQAVVQQILKNRIIQKWTGHNMASLDKRVDDLAALVDVISVNARPESIAEQAPVLYEQADGIFAELEQAIEGVNSAPMLYQLTRMFGQLESVVKNTNRLVRGSANDMASESKKVMDDYTRKAEQSLKTFCSKIVRQIADNADRWISSQDNFAYLAASVSALNDAAKSMSADSAAQKDILEVSYKLLKIADFRFASLAGASQQNIADLSQQIGSILRVVSENPASKRWIEFGKTAEMASLKRSLAAKIAESTDTAISQTVAVLENANPKQAEALNDKLGSIILPVRIALAIAASTGSDEEERANLLSDMLMTHRALLPFMAKYAEQSMDSAQGKQNLNAMNEGIGLVLSNLDQPAIKTMVTDTIKDASSDFVATEAGLSPELSLALALIRDTVSMSSSLSKVVTGYVNAENINFRNVNNVKYLQTANNDPVGTFKAAVEKYESLPSEDSRKHYIYVKEILPAYLLAVSSGVADEIKQAMEAINDAKPVLSDDVKSKAISMMEDKIKELRESSQLVRRSGESAKEFKRRQADPDIKGMAVLFDTLMTDQNIKRVINRYVIQMQNQGIYSIKADGSPDISFIINDLEGSITNTAYFLGRTPDWQSVKAGIFNSDPDLKSAMEKAEATLRIEFDKIRLLAQEKGLEHLEWQDVINRIVFVKASVLREKYKQAGAAFMAGTETIILPIEDESGKVSAGQIAHVYHEGRHINSIDFWTTDLREGITQLRTVQAAVKFLPRNLAFQQWSTTAYKNEIPDVWKNLIAEARRSAVSLEQQAQINGAAKDARDAALRSKGIDPSAKSIPRDALMAAAVAAKEAVWAKRAELGLLDENGKFTRIQKAVEAALQRLSLAQFTGNVLLAAETAAKGTAPLLLSNTSSGMAISAGLKTGVQAVNIKLDNQNDPSKGARMAMSQPQGARLATQKAGPPPGQKLMTNTQSTTAIGGTRLASVDPRLTAAVTKGRFTSSEIARIEAAGGKIFAASELLDIAKLPSIGVTEVTGLDERFLTGFASILPENLTYVVFDRFEDWQKFFDGRPFAPRGWFDFDKMAIYTPAFHAQPWGLLHEGGHIMQGASGNLQTDIRPLIRKVLYRNNEQELNKLIDAWEKTMSIKGTYSKNEFPREFGVYLFQEFMYDETRAADREIKEEDYSKFPAESPRYNEVKEIYDYFQSVEAKLGEIPKPTPAARSIVKGLLNMQNKEAQAEIFEILRTYYISWHRDFPLPKVLTVRSEKKQSGPPLVEPGREQDALQGARLAASASRSGREATLRKIFAVSGIPLEILGVSSAADIRNVELVLAGQNESGKTYELSALPSNAVNKIYVTEVQPERRQEVEEAIENNALIERILLQLSLARFAGDVGSQTGQSWTKAASVNGRLYLVSNEKQTILEKLQAAKTVAEAIEIVKEAVRRVNAGTSETAQPSAEMFKGLKTQVGRAKGLPETIKSALKAAIDQTLADRAQLDRLTAVQKGARLSQLTKIAHQLNPVHVGMAWAKGAYFDPDMSLKNLSQETRVYLNEIHIKLAEALESGLMNETTFFDALYRRLVIELEGTQKRTHNVKHIEHNARKLIDEARELFFITGLNYRLRENVIIGSDDKPRLLDYGLISGKDGTIRPEMKRVLTGVSGALKGRLTVILPKKGVSQEAMDYLKKRDIKFIHADSLEDVRRIYPGDQNISITMSSEDENKMKTWPGAAYSDKAVKLAIAGEETGIGAVLLALMVDKLAEGRQFLMVNVSYSLYQRFKDAYGSVHFISTPWQYLKYLIMSATATGVSA